MVFRATALVGASLKLRRFVSICKSVLVPESEAQKQGEESPAPPTYRDEWCGFDLRHAGCCGMGMPALHIRVAASRGGSGLIFGFEWRLRLWVFLGIVIWLWGMGGEFDRLVLCDG